jgi:hypothetical protein
LSAVSKSSEASVVATAPVLPAGFTAEATKDSSVWLYHYENLLFEGKRGMHLELIKTDHPTVASSDTSLKDTLYQDSRMIVLGRWNESSIGGVFKRYMTKQSPEMYPSAAIYSGPLADPIISSDRNAHHFRTVIKEVCKNVGVNFAGYYTIVEWGCGMECGEMAMVDRRSGRVHLTDIPFDTGGYYGLRYSTDSRLLIVNSFLLVPYDGYYALSSWCTPAAYVWDEKFKRFNLVEKVTE